MQCKLRGLQIWWQAPERNQLLKNSERNLLTKVSFFIYEEEKTNEKYKVTN